MPFDLASAARAGRAGCRLPRPARRRGRGRRALAAASRAGRIAGAVAARGGACRPRAGRRAARATGVFDDTRDRRRGRAPPPADRHELAAGARPRRGRLALVRFVAPRACRCRARGRWISRCWRRRRRSACAPTTPSPTEGSYAPYYAAPLVLLLAILHQRVADRRPLARPAVLAMLGAVAVGLSAYALVGLYADASLRRPHAARDLRTEPRPVPGLQAALDRVDAHHAPGRADPRRARPTAGSTSWPTARPRSTRSCCCPGCWTRARTSSA